MKTKLLMMSTAALLAGTLLASGQGVQQDRGSSGKQESSQGAVTQGQPKGAQEKAKSVQEKGGQAQERRQGQAQERTQGQAPSGAKEEPKGGQAQREQNKQQPQGRAEEQNQQRQGQTQQPSQREQTQGQSQQRERTQGEAPRTQERQQTQESQGSNIAVTLTTEQKTRIRDTVLKEKGAPRAGRVDFSVSEGTVIPRTVHVVEVPPVIVDIHPQWRGFKYFIVNNELVIVEPDTLRIVAVLPV